MTEYKLQIEQRDDFLYAYYEAEKDSFDLSNALWKEISVKMKQHQLSKILVIENIKNKPNSVMEMFSIINSAVRFGFAGKTIAFVDLVEEHYALNKFGENLAFNLGVNAKLFKTKTEAETRLKSQP
jgi:hypothetical protein